MCIMALKIIQYHRNVKTYEKKSDDEQRFSRFQDDTNISKFKLLHNVFTT